MIKTQYLVPEVYYNRSRDFQVIGRTFDLALNYLKTGTDSIKTLPLSEDTDETLIDLIASTLGFKSRHDYKTKQLVSACSVFTEALRSKGSIESLRTVVNAILQAEGVEGEFSVDNRDNTNIIIYVPLQLRDLNLLKDLLDYILPAGVSCEIVRQISVKSAANTELIFDSSLSYKAWKSSDFTSTVTGAEVGEIITSKGKPGLIDNEFVVGKDLLNKEEIISDNKNSN